MRSYELSHLQACFLQEAVSPRPGEGLLYTVIVATAALAANIAVQILTGVKDEFIRRNNLITVDLEHYKIEAFRVLKRDDCEVCGPST